MTFIPTAYAISLWASALIALLTTLAAWGHRFVPGGRSFALMMCAVLVWALMAGMESAAVGVPAKVLFSQLKYVGSSNVAPLFFLFTLAYAGREKAITPIRVVLLWLIPFATVVLAATNSLHGLVWSSFSPGPAPVPNVLSYGHGLWYWISLVYYAVIVLAATIFLLRAALRVQRLYLRQTILLVAGVACPWLGEALYLMSFNPVPGLDLAPIGFAFTGILLLIGMSRFALFDVVPVARSALVERLGDGIVVLDGSHRVVDINPAASAALGVGEDIMGRPASEALGPLGALLPHAGEPIGDAVTELAIEGPEPRHFEVSLSELPGRRGHVGHLIVMHDITARRAAEQEKVKLIGELTTALAEVKTLSGMLPVCASCGKIRDDSGYWQSIEQYVSAHSTAQFSHGLCEDCMRKLYPDLMEDDEPPERPRPDQPGPTSR
jgi:PAS domain-containing protein